MSYRCAQVRERHIPQHTFRHVVRLGSEGDNKIPKAVVDDDVIKNFAAALEELRQVQIRYSTTETRPGALSKIPEAIRNLSLLFSFRETGCRAQEVLSLKWGEFVIDDLRQVHTNHSPNGLCVIR